MEQETCIYDKRRPAIKEREVENILVTLHNRIHMDSTKFFQICFSNFFFSFLNKTNSSFYYFVVVVKKCFISDMRFNENVSC